MKKLVIFDMDGFLLDTETIHNWTWKETFSNFNLDISDEKRLRLFGLGHTDYSNYIKNLINDDSKLPEIRQFQRECIMIILIKMTRISKMVH